MGSRLGRRVLHFANLPIKLMLPPAPLASVQEFAIKTVPSASKIDIRRCLESMYGFSIAEVRTLNMEGKKLRRGRFLAAKPDYKKAYVTLQAPLHVSPDIFPIGAILGERERKASAANKEVGKFPWNGMRLTTKKPARKRHYPAKKKGGVVLRQRSHRGSALRAKRSFVA